MPRSSRDDPFAKLDQVGVGRLMDMAVKLGKTDQDLPCTVASAASTGGDPSSVEFCNKLGLDYVSCSPYRVPIARLAAAQAAIAQKKRIIAEKLTAPCSWNRAAFCAVSMAWSYIGEVVFNILVLVSAVKMADRVVCERMGL